MYITATRVDATTFRVDGDHVASFPGRLRVRLSQGVNGQNEGTVVSASYDAVTLKTSVIIDHATVYSTLYRVELGSTYSDPVTQTGNIGEHEHTGPWDGGFMAASQLTQEIIDNFVMMPLLSECAGNELIGANADGSDWELKAPQLKLLSDVDATVTDNGVAGDLLVRGASKYGRFPIGDAGQALSLDDDGVMVWGEVMRWQGMWADATFYAIGSVVNHGGALYYAKESALSSTATNEPGVSVYWTDVWDEMIAPIVGS